jgi:hypothetical protein
MWLTGTADGRFFRCAAGYSGFDALCGGCDNGALYGNLRQYADCHSGHFGCVQCGFLRDYVMPLLVTSSAPATPAPPMMGPDGAPVQSTTYSVPAGKNLLPAGRSGIAPISDSLRIP